MSKEEAGLEAAHVAAEVASVNRMIRVAHPPGIRATNKYAHAHACTMSTSLRLPIRLTPSVWNILLAHSLTTLARLILIDPRGIGPLFLGNLSIFD